MEKGGCEETWAGLHNCSLSGEINSAREKKKASRAPASIRPRALALLGKFSDVHPHPTPAREAI